jgi:hypothetical protein
VLANLFLHYAFDAWMARTFPTVAFERYVDDAVVHCVSKAQADMVARAIGDRMVEVGLRLHPDKTKIVYCKDGNRRGEHEHTAFTFLGYTFRARGARTRAGKVFTSFAPAISKDALKKSRSADGDLIVRPAEPSPTSHDGSTRSCEAGCSITGGSTAPRCTGSCNASTPT